MYGWQPSGLTLVRFWHALMGVIHIFLFYCGLCAFQFDSTAGLSHMVSSVPLTDNERLWLATNIAVLVSQLLLLTHMWTWFRVAATRRSEDGEADSRVELTTLVDLLPYWGLLRGSRSLYFILRKTVLASTRVDLATLLATASVFVSTVFALLLWSSATAVRLVTLVFPLLGVDAMASIAAQATAGMLLPYFPYADQLIPSIFSGIHNKPRYASGSMLLLQVALQFALQVNSTSWISWYTFVIFPPLSATMLLRFLLVRHIPEYAADPIPLPSSPKMPTKPFCQVCHRTILAKMKAGGLKEYSTQTHHWTTRSLRKSATEGCRICTTVWRDMTTHQIPHTFVFGRMTTWEALNRANYVIVTSRYGSTTWFCLFGLTEDEVKVYISPRIPENHTGSHTSLNLAKEWLSTCQRNHPLCRSNRDVYFRPSRLLHLGADNCVRLHASKTYSDALSYITLSHRWGNAQFIQLRKSNEQAFRKGIPWDSLPQTFKDAIRIARHLGIEYIWIDSLCILQDSSEDWLAEAALMGSVYKNATLNIAASGASNSLEGCLYTRSHRILRPERLPWSFEPLKTFYLANQQMDFYELTQLYDRAWVLQEFMLARRTLDCGRHQLFWRCDESMVSEEAPAGSPPLVFSWNVSHPSRNLSGSMKSILSLRSIMKGMERWKTEHREILQGPNRGEFEEISRYHMTFSPSKCWHELVEIYSRMSLTRDTDRPIAIAGVLDAFRPHLGEYWAGMWRELLPVELLWSTQYEHGPPGPPKLSNCYKPSSRRAPSWSWMSLEGPVYFHAPLKDILLSQVLHVEAVCSVDIRLRIRGPLIRATRVDEYTGIFPRTLLTLGFRPVVSGRCILDTEGINKWRIIHDPQGNGDVDSRIHLHFDVGSFEKTVRDVGLLPISYREDDSNSYVKGLVLQENGTGSFTRVGDFITSRTATKIFLQSNKTEVVLV